MKKSSKVRLTVVAAIGMAACGERRPDPCQPQSFNDQACQDAVQHHGYYWHGTWMPMTYGYPYPYYYDSYRRYASTGGTVTSAPTGSYSATGSVERGGFGDTGAGHGAGGDGAGE